MCAEQSFRLGYSTITWGPTPDLDRVFGTIADVFTSLTTTRPFRTANTTYEAIRIMSQDMASQLDMNVLKVFIQILGV